MSANNERAAYELRRAEAIRGIAKLAGARDGDAPIPLDEAARFLPDHPEWARYAPKRLRRTVRK